MSSSPTVWLTKFARRPGPTLIHCFVYRRFVVIFMASITIFSACLNTEDSHPKQTTSSLGTTSTEASNPLKPFACSSRTRSSTQKTSSSSVGIMSVHQSIAYMASMMNARGGITSSCGKRSRIASIACRLQQSLTRKFSQCMGD